jgi:cold shock CspA family protein
MQVPIEISFRGVESDPSTEDLIRRKAAKLEQVCGKITSLRVSIEQDQKIKGAIQPYRLRLDVNIPPGKEFVVKRESTGGHLPADLQNIIRDAFDAARRKAQKVSEKKQGKVKQHPEQETNAVVEKLFHGEDYGFLKSLDGRDIYFHKNSLIDREFDDLRPGDGVTFTAELGNEGLQATSVHVVNRPSE